MFGQEAPALVVLVGASGSGKSTWAAENYSTPEVVSSDALRAVVGVGPHDLDASVDAFAILDQIVAARCRRRLTTVVDTLGLDPARRREYLELARASGLRAVAVLFQAPAALCRQRNASRNRPVPAPALAAQLKRVAAVETELADEPWDDRLMIVTAARAPAPNAARGVDPPVAGLEFILQLSRFPWPEDPLTWLAEMARAAADAGFTGIAVMDHLMQIPQVGRAWEPMPEAWVTLGALAGLDLGLKLGTLVSPVSFRAPGITAKAAATLDVLTGGRGFCGVGAGWWEREHAGHGLPFPPPKERLDQLERTIETLRALWSPGTKAHTGDRVALPETTSYPRPLGRLPIIVGGSGERTMRIAAAMADGCNFLTNKNLPAKIDKFHALVGSAGRDRSEVAVTVLDRPDVDPDGGQPAAQRIARYAGMSALGVSTVFLAPSGLRGPRQLEAFRAVTAAFR